MKKLMAAMGALGLSAVGLVGLAAAPAQAATPLELFAGTPDEFCTAVQMVTANLDQDQVDGLGGITNVLYDEENAFVLSKSDSTPLTTRQYTIVTEAGVTQTYCKGRSVDALEDAYPELTPGPGPETQCAVGADLIVEAAWNKLSAAEKGVAAYTPDDVTVLPDIEWEAGPQWASFAPPAETLTVEGGGVEIQPESLLVSIDNPSPIGPEFKGNHYCTLPSVESVRATLRGTAPVPTPSPTPTPAQPNEVPVDTEDDGDPVDPENASGTPTGTATTELAATGSATTTTALIALVAVQLGLVLAVRAHRSRGRATLRP